MDVNHNFPHVNLSEIHSYFPTRSMDAVKGAYKQKGKELKEVYTEETVFDLFRFVNNRMPIYLKR
jgi:hypothetical protein